MKTLRRKNLKDQYYFITIVTLERKSILLNDINLFWNSWSTYKLYAWVILPDHFHCILKVNDNDISKIIHNFKIKYSRLYRDKYQPGKVWQNRFWDHMVRNQEDMNKHLDYIHYNPVKHNYVNNPHEYQYSSLTSFYDDGYYEKDWGIREPLDFDDNFGE